MLLDIHTHVSSPSLACIVNAEVLNFAPQAHAFYSVGVHPWHTSTDVKQAWEHVQQWAGHPSVLAIGEAGIDKLRGGPIDYQLDVFEQHIALSESVGKPLVIHCVKAFNELISLHKHYRPKQCWVVHGYRNNWHIAQQLLAEGLFLSFGERFNAEVVQHMPEERMFAETDESALPITAIIQQLADCRQVSVETFVQQLHESVRFFFFDR